MNRQRSAPSRSPGTSTTAVLPDEVMLGIAERVGHQEGSAFLGRDATVRGSASRGSFLRLSTRVAEAAVAALESRGIGSGGEFEGRVRGRDGELRVVATRNGDGWVVDASGAGPSGPVASRRDEGPLSDEKQPDAVRAAVLDVARRVAAVAPGAETAEILVRAPLRPSSAVLEIRVRFSRDATEATMSAPLATVPERGHPRSMQLALAVGRAMKVCEEFEEGLGVMRSGTALALASTFRQRNLLRRSNAELAERSSRLEARVVALRKTGVRQTFLSVSDERQASDVVTIDPIAWESFQKRQLASMAELAEVYPVVGVEGDRAVVDVEMVVRVKEGDEYVYEIDEETLVTNLPEHHGIVDRLVLIPTERSGGRDDILVLNVNPAFSEDLGSVVEEHARRFPDTPTTRVAREFVRVLEGGR